jgi:hypothetical protein
LNSVEAVIERPSGREGGGSETAGASDVEEDDERLRPQAHLSMYLLPFKVAT